MLNQQLEVISFNDRMIEYLNLKNCILKIDPKAFAERLDEACDSYGLPQKNKGRSEQLSQIVGVSKMTVSYWFDGKFLPSRAKRELIADKLNVSQNYLEFGYGELHDTALNRRLKKVDFKFVSKGKYNEERIFDNYPVISVEIDSEYPDAFATTIYDDAMYPIYPRETIVIIDPNSSIRNNSIVAFFNKNKQEIIIRQYIDAGAKKFLIPINNDYETYQITENVKVIGLVVYVQMSSFHP